MVREAGTLAKDGGELARVSCEVGGTHMGEVAGGGHPFEI